MRSTCQRGSGKSTAVRIGDRARVASAHGAITVPSAHMAALNENTVWTWNAIGTRKRARALAEVAPEATRGFLLNHLIHELLLERGDGLCWSKSDPITGQTAWLDLCVGIETTPAPRQARPSFPPIASQVARVPDQVEKRQGG